MPSSPRFTATGSTGDISSRGWPCRLGTTSQRLCRSPSSPLFYRSPLTFLFFRSHANCISHAYIEFSLIRLTGEYCGYAFGVCSGRAGRLRARSGSESGRLGRRRYSYYYIYFTRTAVHVFLLLLACTCTCTCTYTCSRFMCLKRSAGNPNGIFHEAAADIFRKY